MLIIKNYLKYQKGASLIEFLFAIPLFLFLVGGIIEMNYLYRSKVILNTATLNSAREGAITNASKQKMKNTLIEGMSPLFAKGSINKTNTYQAYINAKIFAQLMDAQTSTSELGIVTIIHPTRSVFNTFSKNIPLLENKKEKVKLVKAIPNDNLMYRSTKTKSVNVNGKSINMNVQDANLIKINTLWCHELKIPGLRDIAKTLILDNPFINSTEEQKLCNFTGEVSGPYKGIYVAITAQAIARAQSPIFLDNLD